MTFLQPIIGEQRRAEREKSTRLRAFWLANKAADRETAALAAVRKAVVTKATAKKLAAKRRKTVASMDAVSA
jgi:hypothetical protein